MTELPRLLAREFHTLAGTAGRFHPVKIISKRNAVRIFSVTLSMLCLLQQLSATCSSNGHSSIIVDSILAPCFDHADISGRDEHHSTCCHHRHHQPTPPAGDRSRPDTPSHLCSAAHQIFTITSYVELPDDSNSSFGEKTFDVTFIPATSIENSTCPSNQLHQRPPRALSLRAQFQIIQI